MFTPKISVIIPTLNSERTIKDCFKSISEQNYPKSKIEIIVADGGSIDNTLKIAKEFDSKILKNRLKTGEAGKALGAKSAKGEILAFIDSDNILPSGNWFREMIKPFEEKNIIASEPIEYTYRRTDPLITRYSALMGMNDPLCYFLGNYDRVNALSGKWTGMKHVEDQRKGYISVGLFPGKIPTIGANGFLIRKSVLREIDFGDYIFDIDILHELVRKNPGLRIAKVETGIIHVFSGSISTFIRKQKRRVHDHKFYTRKGIRKDVWRKTSCIRLSRFAFFTLSTVPLIMQSFWGWTKKRDSAWFFHIPACWTTLLIYSLGKITKGPGMVREGWRQ